MKYHCIKLNFTFQENFNLSFETICMKVSMRKFISQKKKKSLSSGFKGWTELLNVESLKMLIKQYY